MRGLAVVLLTACAVSETSTTEQAIIGGDPSPDDNSVVLLVAYPADRSTMYTCTASVIAPNALVTAAHCIDHTNYVYGVFFGADAMQYTNVTQILPQLAPVTSTHVFPTYSRSAPFNGDIAVVKLANPAPVPVLPFARVAPSAGVPARIVGYGQQVYGNYNAVRRQATTMLAAIDAGDTITVGDAQRRTCIGDSGGPALVMIAGVEHVAGVNSYGPVGCTAPAHFRRTDMYAAFIDQHAGTAPPMPDPEPDPEPDPDPDPMMNDDGGGCATSSHGGLSLLVLLAIFGIARRTARCPRA